LREQSSGQAALLPDLSRAVWRKSSHSNAEGGECVEIATVTHRVAIRDSKHPHGPALAIDADQWRAFLRATKDRQHDLA
jgi:hypothetical protein